MASNDCRWPSRSALSISRAYWQPAHGNTSVARPSSSSFSRSDMSDGGAAASLDPSIPHAVHRLDRVEARLERLELASNALHVRGDRVVVEHDVRRIHQLLPVLDVPGMAR